MFQLEDYVLSYMLDFETKQSETLLNVAKLDAPFDYKLCTVTAKTSQLPVDLPETFNYLIGLHVASRRVYENKGTRYLVYRGQADGRETVDPLAHHARLGQEGIRGRPRFRRETQAHARRGGCFREHRQFYSWSAFTRSRFSSAACSTRNKPCPQAITSNWSSGSCWRRGVATCLAIPRTRRCSKSLREVEEGYDSKGGSFLVQRIASRGSKCLVTPEDLERYDANIRSHLHYFNQHRKERLTLRYFQHLSLLISGIVPGLPLQSRDEVAEGLNQFVRLRNNQRSVLEAARPGI